jgi:3-oxoacyl-[acyl-carrier protein] reductase
MGRLTGKVALVTGASRGIGKAIALAYAREGARVFISARGKKDLAATVEEIRGAGGAANWHAADVSKAKDVKRLVQEVIHCFGAIHPRM